MNLYKRCCCEYDTLFTFRTFLFIRRCILRTFWIFPCNRCRVNAIAFWKVVLFILHSLIICFFEIFYKVVVKVFVKVIMSENRYLSAIRRLFPIILTEQFLILFFPKFFFSWFIFKYLRWFKYFSNKCFSTINESQKSWI